MSKGYIGWLPILAATLLVGGCRSNPSPPSDLGSETSASSGTRTSPGGGSTGGTASPFGRPGDALAGRGPGVAGSGREIRGLLPSVYFAYDQFALEPPERTKLDRAAAHLQENAAHKLRVEAHCDWRGTAEYNQALGDRRAQSVRTYLTTLGVPEERVETLSFGDLKSTPEGTEEQMRNDRRADLVVLPGP